MPSGLFKGKPQIEGEIGYFGLADWWLAAFTDAERKYIERRYRPLGSGEKERPLTQGKITYSTGSAVSLLTALATWFQGPKDRQLARRILAKAEELATSADVLDRHFLYQQVAKTYYPDRDSDPGALQVAISACEKQIALGPSAVREWKRKYPKDDSLPAHYGYTQLCIIWEKQGRYAEVVQLCNQAKRQGWAGDWDNRIARCQKKLAKSKQ